MTLILLVPIYAVALSCSTPGTESDQALDGDRAGGESSAEELEPVDEEQPSDEVHRDGAKVDTGQGWQHLERPDLPPTSREGAGFAYDSQQGRALLFGGEFHGHDDAEMDGQIWIWTQGQWTSSVPSEGGPSQRKGTALSYHEDSGRMVLVGGSPKRSEPVDETWVLDEQGWREIDSSLEESPSPRYGHAMAYDESLEQVILYGGHGSDGITWGFDGQAWAKLAADTGGPGDRVGHAMAYDHSRGEVVLFGGELDDEDRALWAFDGQNWREIDVNGGLPAARAGHVLVADSSRDRLILHGGFREKDGARLGDTWVFQTDQWTQIGDRFDGPHARSDHQAIFDSSQEELILFSGRAVSPRTYLEVSGPISGSETGGQLATDTWSLDGEEWTLRAGWDVGPPPRVGPAMTYDRDRDVVVAYGGFINLVGVGEQHLADTWLWDGERWRIAAESMDGPGIRWPADLTYDVARQRAVLVSLRGLWEWDGSQWEERLVEAEMPDGVVGFSVVYDTELEQTIIYDGAEDSRSAPRMWHWDGHELAVIDVPDDSPTALKIGYDEERRELILYGGHIPEVWQRYRFVDDDEVDVEPFPSETYRWSGEAWELVASDGPPPRRDNAAMEFDHQRRQLILFGGEEAGDHMSAHNDLWAWDGRRWQEIETGEERPRRRQAAGMTFDPNRGQMMTAGGYFMHIGGHPELRPMEDLWHLDGDRWEFTVGLGQTFETRRDHLMVYDEAREQILSFGGWNYETGRHLGTTFVWDGRWWRQVADADEGPGPQPGASLVYDSEEERVLLIGKDAQIWRWDGANWLEVEVGNGSDIPSAGAATYDEFNQRVLVFDEDQRLWSWAGSDWEEIEVDGPTPTAHIAHQLAYDRHHDQVLLVGGYEEIPGSPDEIRGTWIFDGEGWQEVAEDEQLADRAFHSVNWHHGIERLVLFGGVKNQIFDDPVDEPLYWDGEQWQPLEIDNPSPRSHHGAAYDPTRDQWVVDGGRILDSQVVEVPLTNASVASEIDID